MQKKTNVRKSYYTNIRTVNITFAHKIIKQITAIVNVMICAATTEIAANS